MAHHQAPTSITASHPRRARSARAICAAAVTVLGAVTVPAPAVADGGCIPGDTPGQVPRNTRPGDNVCVPQSIADLVQQENAASAQGQGHDPNGPYGPISCVSGLVWREGFDGDSVCVTPARRSETWQENANAGVGNTGGLQPQTTPPGGSVGTGGPDGALLAAVNDARLHPENYPPHGDATGALMTACPNALRDSGALDNAASTHNHYIASQPAGSNPHMNANGKLSWEDGGPIAQSGYNRLRGEIVAIGQGSEAAAVVAWMQDDATASPPWGHRNNILNCDFTDAGAAHLTGGPGNDYWTVDLGAH